MSERLLGIRPSLAIAGLAGLAMAFGLYGFGLGIGVPRLEVSRSEITSRAQRFAESRKPGTGVHGAIFRYNRETYDDSERFVRVYGAYELETAKSEGAFTLRTWDARIRSNAVTSDFEDDKAADRVTFDELGNIVGFETHAPDDSAPAPPRDQARQIAAEELARLGIKLDGYVEPTQKTVTAGNIKVTTANGVNAEVVEDQDDDQSDSAGRADKSVQKFVWRRDDPRWPGLQQKVTASVTGSGLVEFSRSSEFEATQIPARIITAVVEGTLFGILATLLVLVLLGALLFRLLSRDYVSRSRAALVAGIFAATVAFSAALTFSGKNSLLENFMGQTFAGLGMAILVGAAWLAGETDAYYAWGRHSTEAALALATGSPRARQVGRELIEGFAWGWLLLGVLAIVATIVAVASGTGGVYRSHELAALDTGPLPLYWTAVLPFVFFYAVCCLLFVPAWLHRLTKRAWIAIPLAGIVAGVFASTIDLVDVRFGPLPGTLSWGIAFGIATCTLVAWRGWLTGAVATFAFSAFYWGISGMYSAAMFDKALIGAGMLLAAGAPIVALIAGPRRFVDVAIKETPPARVSRMLELVRREEELDIARRVQRGLLPTGDPVVEGFEIAGTCLPANEVGGDYYDYFSLADGRFGVAVGDVSGKGIPAAFSMTLTKGFMEVASADFREPDRVLSQANGYLRQNLTRGTFVTMAYAILDPEARVVTCARAGHNPPAIVRADEPPTFLMPGGPALGATDSDRFDELVERQRVELRRGDTMVLYTDGVTESMNVQREQFGEDRLLETLGRHRSATSARQIVDALLGEVESFAQYADQHDDITIVVIRVPEG
ncbi:MAG TPA: SpoIIE family protein phosphatase [Blastocatellia bacterium]|nr:SpoIIE family protein phosphatase [Blastocatellia bacterium]